MRSALRLRPFLRLAATYTLNEFVDWLSSIALTVVVYDRTGDALATTALFVAAKFLPAFLAQGLTTRMDGVDARTALPVLYLVQAAAFGALARLVGSASLPVILAVTLVSGTVAISARALTRATTVAVLEPAGVLRDGNALLNIGFSVAAAAGPALAGVGVAAGGADVTLAASAGLLVLLAAVLAAGPFPRPEVHGERFVARLRDGIRHVAQRAPLRLLIGGQAILLVLFTMVTPIEVVYVKETLHSTDAGFGALLAAWGAGTVLGSMVFVRERHRPVLVLVALSTAAVAVSYVGMAVVSTLLSACMLSVLGGAGNGVQWVAVVTAVQEAADLRFLTRVSGLLESVAAAMPGLGFILGGALTAALSPRLAYGVAGGLALAVTGAGALRWTMTRQGGGGSQPEPASSEAG